MWAAGYEYGGAWGNRTPKTRWDGEQRAENRGGFIKKIRLEVKRLENFKGELPRYESEFASGFDVRAQLPDKLILKPGERALVATGLAFAVEPGYEIQARPRSGLAVKKGISLVNTPGTIDSDYRGEVKIILINHGLEAVAIEDQERIAQLVVCPVYQADFAEVKELSATVRGAAPFATTGAL